MNAVSSFKTAAQWKRESLEREVAWLMGRVKFWSEKEDEFRTKVPPIPVSDAHTYSLIRYAKQKRKDYQSKLKEAQESLSKES